MNQGEIMKLILFNAINIWEIQSAYIDNLFLNQLSQKMDYSSQLYAYSQFLAPF